MREHISTNLFSQWTTSLQLFLRSKLHPCSRGCVTPYCASSPSLANLNDCCVARRILLYQTLPALGAGRYTYINAQNCGVDGPLRKQNRNTYCISTMIDWLTCYWPDLRLRLNLEVFKLQHNLMFVRRS